MQYNEPQYFSDHNIYDSEPMAYFTNRGHDPKIQWGQIHEHEPRSWSEAAKTPWASDWKTPCDAEWSDLMRTAFDEVLETKIPSSAPPPVPITGFGTCKFGPNGEVLKLKWRYCARGDLHSSPYDTAAPVPMMQTLNTFNSTVASKDLNQTQFDWTAAFCSTPCEEEIYIRPPPERRKWMYKDGQKRSTATHRVSSTADIADIYVR
jgi:hypothetical protein